MVIFCAALALLLFLGVIAYLITSDGKKTIKKQKTSQKQHVAEKTKKFDTDLDKMIIAASIFRFWKKSYTRSRKNH